MSVSVIRSEGSTPSATYASTDRSDPDRTSEAVSPLSGSKSVPSSWASGRDRWSRRWRHRLARYASTRRASSCPRWDRPAARV